MNSSTLFAGFSSCFLAIAGLSGCYVSTEPGPGPVPEPIPVPGVPIRTGTVTLSWTVAGSHSAPACTQFGATTLELVITDSRLRPVMTVTAPCSDFSVTTRLPAGDYEAEARLLDARSSDVSTALPLHDIRVIPGTDLTLDIEFPSSSRL
jgi:hypothetical protein